MTSELHTRFERIKAHYRPHMRAMAARRDEWVIDAYAWDDQSIRMHLTPIEWALWHDIRAENAVMYPQIPVGPFFVDFGNPGAMVAIECDGKQWHTDKAKDAARDRALEAMGWPVYRITGRDCFTDTEETDDEFGHTIVTLSTARRFVIDICDRHSIRRGCLRTEWRGPVHISEAMDRALMRLQDRAAA